MAAQSMALTLREILRQPDSWGQTVSTVTARVPRVSERFRSTQPDLYLFTGCGTSYYLSIAAAGFFQEVTGLPARAVPASELILSGATHLPSGRKAALFAFSRSGETTETTVALRQHRAADRGPTVSITCRSVSAMAESGDIGIQLPSADDQSVVMTSSFTSMLLAAELIAAAVAGNQSLFDQLASLPSLLGAQLEDQRRMGEALGRDLAYRQFIFLGIGPLFGLASEAMLKLKEMTQVPCEAYSPLEFRHGPISIVEPGTLVVLLGSDRAAQQEMDVLQDVSRLGGQTLYLGPTVPATGTDLTYTTGDGLPDAARALLYMPVLQSLAYYRAMMLGRDPDRPQHLTRVVTLDERALARGGS